MFCCGLPPHERIPQRAKVSFERSRASRLLFVTQSTHTIVLRSTFLVHQRYSNFYRSCYYGDWYPTSLSVYPRKPDENSNLIKKQRYNFTLYCRNERIQSRSSVYKPQTKRRTAVRCCWTLPPVGIASP